MLLPLVSLLLLPLLTCAVATATASDGVDGAAAAVSFYVSATTGDDAAAGSNAAPFRTLSRCAAALMEVPGGGSCEVGAGTYRETLTLPAASGSRPLAFHAGTGTAGARPVLSGLDKLDNLTWTRGGGGITASRDKSSTSCVFVAELPPNTPSFQQLFYNGEAMIEARWPNVKLETFRTDILDKEKAWQPTSKGSLYGHIVDPALAESRFSWDGGLATLQVAHQFFTWTRRVANHSVGGSFFEYPKDLPGLAEWSEPQRCWGVNTTHETCNQDWSKNQYFLSGKLEALDSIGEWFLEEGPDQSETAPVGNERVASRRLHFYPPDGCESAPSGVVEVKARCVCRTSRHLSFHMRAWCFAKSSSGLRYCTVSNSPRGLL
jgi:hypothetical protein